MKTLFIQDGIVVGHASVQASTASVSGPAGSTSVEVDDSNPATVNWTYAVVSGVDTFTAPTVLAVLTPMQFYLAFTPAERIAIKGSSDPIVKEFWATYQLAAQLNDTIDPNLVSVVEGLGYLATATTATPPGAGILASSARVTQIQAGTPQ